MTEQKGLSQALANLKEEELKSIIKEKLEVGVPAAEILKGCQAGMLEVGSRYQTGEYFIAELMYAGEIMKDIMADLGPMLEGEPEAEGKLGKVIMGTVKGDIHDLGKDVVILALQGAGFEVIDLGVDVAPEKFVEAIKENDATVVGMSVFLTMAYEAATETVNAIKEAGLRDKVFIMIGGGPVTELVREKTGCDFYGKDAADGLEYALEVVGAK